MIAGALIVTGIVVSLGCTVADCRAARWPEAIGSGLCACLGWAMLLMLRAT